MGPVGRCFGSTYYLLFWLLFCGRPAALNATVPETAQPARVCACLAVWGQVQEAFLSGCRIFSVYIATY